METIEELAKQGLVHKAMNLASEQGVDSGKAAEAITNGLLSMPFNFSFSKEKIEERGIN